MPKKLTYEFIKERIEKKDYKLLSKKYEGSHIKLKVQCDKGHEYKVRWCDFKRGQRCPYCEGNAKLTYKFVKEQIEKECYKLLSEKYKNSKTKLKVQCDKGHIYYPKYHNFQQGQRCSYCYGNAKYTYEHVKEKIENVEGYKLLSKNYINANIKLEIQCDKDHKYKMIYGNFQKGQRCPICDAEKQSSKAEKEILKLVKQLLPNVNVIENDRTQIINPKTGHNLELDIYIPSLNKAIEYNGRYWHSLEEVKIRDVERLKQCKEKGIDLLTINEQDWLDNKNEVIKQIKLKMRKKELI